MTLAWISAGSRSSSCAGATAGGGGAQWHAASSARTPNATRRDITSLGSLTDGAA